MPKLRVGIADTLDTRPLAWGFLKGHHADLFEPLSHPVHRVGRLLEHGGVDIALAPSLSVARTAGLRALPDLCVSYAGDSGCVHLVSGCDPARVRRVVGGRQTPTATAALAIVLAERFGTPVGELDLDVVEVGGRARAPGEGLAIEGLAAGEGVLVTGAAAADTARRARLEGAETLDVTAAWYGLTGTPLVVALWAVRRGVIIPGLPFYFKSSLRYGLASLDAIAREAASESSADSTLLERHLRRAVGYFLRAEERCGLEELFRGAGRLGLAPESPEPVSFWR